MKLLRKFSRDNRGATSMEYGLTALLVSVIAILAFSESGEEVNSLYTKVDGAVSETADN